MGKLKNSLRKTLSTTLIMYIVLGGIKMSLLKRNTTKKHDKKDEKKNLDTPVTPTEEPITEYRKTLYTADSKPKEKTEPKKSSTLYKTTTVETSVDSLALRKAEKQAKEDLKSLDDDGFNQKIDEILLRKGKIVTNKKDR